MVVSDQDGPTRPSAWGDVPASGTRSVVPLASSLPQVPPALASDPVLHLITLLPLLWHGIRAFLWLIVKSYLPKDNFSSPRWLDIAILCPICADLTTVTLRPVLIPSSRREISMCPP